MLVSHEVPLSLLDRSREFNDYDYCLLHLTYQYPKYKQFYIDSSKQGRKVILDNSLYELGDALDSDKFAQGILELKPTEYIVPDCFNDANTTMERFKNWKKNYDNIPGIKIGVVQGDNLKDLITCYTFMSVYADKIAIPFGSNAYIELYDNYSRELLDEEKLKLIDNCEDKNLIKRTLGRYMFIVFLIRSKKWDYTKMHHLLGCNLPIEFSYYNNKELFYNIETIDTSNPIIHSIKKTYCDKGYFKHKVKMCDLMEKKLNNTQLDYLGYNLYLFRRFIKI